MNLAELISAYGGDNVLFQSLDACADTMNMAKGHTKITFGTGEPLGPDGTVKMGIVVWMDRGRVAEILAAGATTTAAGHERDVPALEWTNTALHDPYGLIVRVGQTRFGDYQILKGTQGRFSVNFGSVPFSGAMDTLEEAVVWAQSDFEDRLRSPITTSGTPNGEQQHG